MFVRVFIAVLSAFVLWAVVVRPSAATGPERHYVVKPGDTLWSIAAARHAGDPRAGVYELQRRNHLSRTLIAPGQVLVVP